MLNKSLTLMLILPLFLFSQTKKNNGFQSVIPAKLLERGESDDGFKGVSLGVLFQGQSKYPNPYYGPKVDGLFNDGAYHFTIDFYYKKYIVGFQLSDEFLYLEKFDDNGAVWKPRGLMEVIPL